MTGWQTIITVSIFCVCVTHAAEINGNSEVLLWFKLTLGTESVREPVDKPKRIDDVCVTPECIHAASWILTNNKSSIDPCDDFYEFACGNVNLANIPHDRYSRNELDLAEDKLLLRLRSLIEAIDKAKVPKHFGLIRTLYDNCMSTVQGDIDSNNNSLPVYNRFHATNGWPVLVGNKWYSALFDNKSDLLTELLQMVFIADPENSDHNVLWLAMKERGLSSEILRKGFSNDIVQAYYSLMVDTAVLYGATRTQAESELKEALLLGIEFAKCTVPIAKRSIFIERWNRTTLGEFFKKYSKWDIRSWMFNWIPDYALIDNNAIVVEGDFGKFENLLSNASPRVLANWLKWLDLFTLLPTLQPRLREGLQRFEHFAQGEVEKSPRWKECVKKVRSKLGLSLSALYQRKYMSQNIVSDIAGMVTNMKRQLHQLVTQADWLDTEAKREIHQKVDNMITQVSFRDEYVDDKKLEGFYEKVELVEGDLADSLYNISIGTFSAAHRPWYMPIVRNDWIRYGNILDKYAQYTPFANHIQIDAALTLTNLYHVERPKYMNYGTFGFLIGHEMGYSLDINGIQIDIQRNLRKWWSPETKQKYDDHMECLVNQYGNYTIEELGIKLDGQRVASESISDNIGLKLAYHAYLHWAGQNREEQALPGLPYTPKQMFWISMANAWCRKEQKPMFRISATLGTDAPAKQRVNGAFANRQEFADDFKCKPATKMNPVQKCSLF